MYIWRATSATGGGWEQDSQKPTVHREKIKGRIAATYWRENKRTIVIIVMVIQVKRSKAREPCAKMGERRFAWMNSRCRVIERENEK